VEILFVLFLGLCFGSFNTLLAYRLPLGKPIVVARSACPACRKPLGARDLVPLFSWLAACGACRQCKSSIHYRYPCTELVTAATFFIAYAFHGFSVDALLIALLGSHIIALCIIDFEHRIIPDTLQLVMGGIGILYTLNGHLHVADMLAGMAIGAGAGFFLQKGYKFLKGYDGLGTGDVKFMGVAGIWLGVTPLLPFFFYAGVLGVMSALLWRSLTRDPYFPFGPALAISLFLLVIYPPSESWFRLISVQMVTLLGII
jgi:prepilin signal peptidase PulO-like enzyme (type II secretory pathway)